MLEKQLYDSMIGGSFAGSKYIADKIAIPADLLQARFGQAFKVEEGRIVAYDASGNKIYSRAKLANWRSLMRRWSSLSKITLRKTTSWKPVATMAAAPVRHSMILVRKRWNALLLMHWMLQVSKTHWKTVSQSLINTFVSFRMGAGVRAG